MGENVIVHMRAHVKRADGKAHPLTDDNDRAVDDDTQACVDRG